MSEARLDEIIRDSKNLVFFGGAGVSTESGIPDFRSSKGIYQEQNVYPPEQIVSHSFFLRHTEEFYNFYKNRMIFLDAKPNKAHLKLAQLEKMGILTAVITQNIDGLHQMAGSQNVLELHGSIHRNYCQCCHEFYDASYIKNSDGIPKCECGGVIKPDVVLYEEGLNQDIITKTIAAISHADTLIIGGTSLVVYPAASFIDYFQGNNLIVINKTATTRDEQGALCLRGAIGEILGGVCNDL
ncbi:MAG: NAD-dependent protein deacylase [Lachnospiraceae bacterium]